MVSLKTTICPKGFFSKNAGKPFKAAGLKNTFLGFNSNFLNEFAHAVGQTHQKDKACPPTRF